MMKVSDAEAIRTARRLARLEGILAGFSGSTNVAAALKPARRINSEATIATVIPDTGLKYLSTEFFSRRGDAIKKGYKK